MYSAEMLLMASLLADAQSDISFLVYLKWPNLSPCLKSHLPQSYPYKNTLHHGRN